MTSTAKRTAKVGRPRAVSDVAPDTTPRDQILRAAATLFVAQGIGSTSTRAIAEAAGMRQASLYYHFAGKDDILVELLADSVRPALEFSERLGVDDVAEGEAAASLYALALIDIATLTNDPDNIGTLYLSPELRGPRYDAFRDQRAQLQRAYGRLGRSASPTTETVQPSEDLLGALLIHLVEVVIQLRRVDGHAAIDADGLAASCLRLIGLTPGAIDDAAKAARVRFGL